MTLVNGFTRFDGRWYTRIARLGYGSHLSQAVQTRWPFFPLLPAVMRGLITLGLPDQLGIVVLNQLLFLVALAGVYRIARRHTSMRASALGIWALALFPASFVFSMIYPSAILLAASVWAFVFVEDERDLEASACVLAVTLVRPNGVLIVIAILFSVRSLRRAALICGPAVAAFGAWCLFQSFRVGDPLAFWSAKAAWREISVLEPGGLFNGSAAAGAHLLLAGVALWLVWRARARLPRAWSIWTGLYVLPSLFFGIVGMARYVNDCFVPFVAAGDVLERRSRGTVIAVLATSALLLVAATAIVMRTPAVP